jgi:Uma2 family endonuclease
VSVAPFDQIVADAPAAARHPFRWNRVAYERVRDLGLIPRVYELIGGRIIEQLYACEPREHCWSREEYFALAEAGLFEGRRVELIGGKVIEMSPIGFGHAASLSNVLEVMFRVFGGGKAVVRSQSPLSIDGGHVPEPDVAVVQGPSHRYRGQHPSTALLVIEIADTSLAADRTEKASLYAKAGVEDYWIVNLLHRQLEVFRDPQPDTTQAFGFGYAATAVMREGEFVSPLAAPAERVEVGDLLP